MDDNTSLVRSGLLDSQSLTELGLDLRGESRLEEKGTRLAPSGLGVVVDWHVVPKA